MTIAISNVKHTVAIQTKIIYMQDLRLTSQERPQDFNSGKCQGQELFKGTPKNMPPVAI